MKWKAQNTKVPVAFLKAYPDAVFEEISRTDYLAFVGGEMQAGPQAYKVSKTS